MGQAAAASAPNGHATSLCSGSNFDFDDHDQDFSVHGRSSTGSDSYSQPGYGGDYGGASSSAPITGSHRDRGGAEQYERRRAGFEHEHVEKAYTSGPRSIAMRTEDLRVLLVSLEYALGLSPSKIPQVGAAYDALSRWTIAHKDNEDLDAVLDGLEHKNMYPAWRRQALEETYVLFYEDIERAGGQDALQQLPPPPVSYDERSQEQVQVGATALGSGRFETGSRLWHSEHWEYELRPNIPASSNSFFGQDQVAGVGRKIVDKGRSSRYCMCATDVATVLGCVDPRRDADSIHPDARFGPPPPEDSRRKSRVGIEHRAPRTEPLPSRDRWPDHPQQSKFPPPSDSAIGTWWERAKGVSASFGQLSAEKSLPEDDPFATSPRAHRQGNYVTASSRTAPAQTSGGGFFSGWT